MRRRSLVLPSVLALLLAGCIDDPTAVEEEGAPILSEQEIEFLGLTALAKSLEAQEAAEDSTATSAGSPARSILLGGPAAAPVALNESVSTTVPCDLGGEMVVDVALQGEFDDETDVGELTFTMTLTPNFCGVQSEEGFTATLFGDPAFATTLRFTSDGSGVYQVGGGITGGLGVLTGGRVASCRFDLSFSGTQTESGGDILVEGTACGEEISSPLGGSEAAA